MSSTGLRAKLFILVAALLAAAATPATAATLTFKANLQGVGGSNSKATGVLTALYDTDTKQLSWRGTYKRLGTYAIGASFHGPAAADQNAGIVVRLRSFDNPFDGTAILSDKQAGQLIAGRWYILVRTAAHPAGEIRGQILGAN